MKKTWNGTLVGWDRRTWFQHLLLQNSHSHTVIIVIFGTISIDLFWSNWCLPAILFPDTLWCYQSQWLCCMSSDFFYVSASATGRDHLDWWQKSQAWWKSFVLLQCMIPDQTTKLPLLLNSLNHTLLINCYHITRNCCWWKIWGHAFCHQVTTQGTMFSWHSKWLFWQCYLNIALSHQFSGLFFRLCQLNISQIYFAFIKFCLQAGMVTFSQGAGYE